MEWPLARAAIDFYFDHTVETGPYTLQFHGAGEPAVNADIIEKAIHYARGKAQNKNQGLFTRISTNGFFPEDTARRLADVFNHVSLSLDGPPDIHNAQRPGAHGEDTYETVLQTLRIFEEKGVLKRINTVVTDRGINRMEEILRHIRSVSGIKSLRLLPMEYCGRCESTGISRLDFGLFTHNLEKILPLAGSLDFELLSGMEQADYYITYYCHACGLAMCVAPHGGISTCVEVMDKNSGADELLIGAYEDGRIEIDWDKVMTLRKRNWRFLEPCGGCVFRTNCSGNCLVRAGRKNGTVMSVDKDACEKTRRLLTGYFCDLANTAPLLSLMSEWNQSNTDESAILTICS
jgi:uncharacterized protein